MIIMAAPPFRAKHERYRGVRVSRANTGSCAEPVPIAPQKGRIDIFPEPRPTARAANIFIAIPLAQ